MFAAIAAARSGLLASVTRLNAAASNIANSATTGPLPATPAAQPIPPASEESPRVYQPVDVVQTSFGEGTGAAGVSATYRPRLPAYTRQYDPSAPFADADGFVATPKVDLAEEAVGVIEASLAFRANLAVLRRAADMAESLFDRRA